VRFFHERVTPVEERISLGVRVIEFPPLPLHWVTWAVAAIGPAHTPRLNEYNGTSLIKHGDSENGRWLVVKFENVKHKIKKVVEQLSVLKFALLDLKKCRAKANPAHARN
jgi:hypothetical protein